MDKWRYHPGVARLAEIARERRTRPVVGLRHARRLGEPARRRRVWMLAPHDLSIAPRVLGTCPSRVARSLRPGRRGRRARRRCSARGPWHMLEVSTVARPPREVRLVARTASPCSRDGYSDLVQSTAQERRRAEERRRLGRAAAARELRAFVEHLEGGPPPKRSAARAPRSSRRSPAERARRACRDEPRRHRPDSDPRPRTDAAALASERAGPDGRRLEVFVVGDGVRDVTRELMAELIVPGRRASASSTTRRAPRHGEDHRHAALPEAARRDRLLPQDDDLWLPDHVETMLAAARGRRLRARPAALHRAATARPRYVSTSRSRHASCFSAGERDPLSCGAHTLAPIAACRRMAADTGRGTHRPVHVAAVPRCARLPRRERYRLTVLHLPSPARVGWTRGAAAGGARRVVERGFELETPAALDAWRQVRASRERAAREAEDELRRSRTDDRGRARPRAASRADRRLGAKLESDHERAVRSSTRIGEPPSSPGASRRASWPRAWRAAQMGCEGSSSASSS